MTIDIQETRLHPPRRRPGAGRLPGLLRQAGRDCWPRPRHPRQRRRQHVASLAAGVACAAVLNAAGNSPWALGLVLVLAIALAALGGSAGGAGS